ncbi:MAG: patatin family protein [Coriobacteriales bacterium]
MIGVVDVGGGLRGAYGAGVFDWCLDNGLAFDCCVGVSAGSANVAAYIGKQRGRNLRFYEAYSQRSEYMGLRALVRSHSFLSVDYVYGTLSNSGGEDPLDYQAMRSSSQQFHAVATDASTGEPVYFTLDDMGQDDYLPLKASSSVPLVCRPHKRDGRAYYDGGISDPIPLQHAFDLGCSKVAVILTRPSNFYRDPRKDAWMARLLSLRWPRAGEALRKRAQLYNRELDFAKEQCAEGRALIIAPDSIGEMGTLTKDIDAIHALYCKGYKDAEQLAGFAG